MASSTLALPASFHHKPTPALRKSKLDSSKVRSEDELLKFFLHGSYDVQRGSTPNSSAAAPTPILNEEIAEKSLCLSKSVDALATLHLDEKQTKSRFMFEETYMINISVKQPDAAPSSKQIDVRIEKTPMSEEKIDEDEVSSIFDEEENDDLDSVVFNDINSSIAETPATPLTLADMINKSLTTIPPAKENGKKVTPNPPWLMEKPLVEEHKAPMEKKRLTPPPAAKPTLTTNLAEDEKLFEYLDYLETKEEAKVKIVSARQRVSPPLFPPLSQKKETPVKPICKPVPPEPIPIVDLEQLCRSLNVHDLKDEAIRKKIYELKLLIDARHEKPKSQIPLIKPRRDPLPVLIAMPAAPAQRRRTTVVQPSQLLQSKTVNFQGSFYDVQSNSLPKPTPPTHPSAYVRRANPQGNNRKYQFTWTGSSTRLLLIVDAWRRKFRIST